MNDLTNRFRTNRENAPASKQTVDMVREQNGKVIRATLPVGRGWNQGNLGAIDWINLGWQSYDAWAEKKHQKEVEAKREAAKDKKNV